MKLQNIEREIENTPKGNITDAQDRACLVFVYILGKCRVSAEFRKLAKGIMFFPDSVKIYDDICRYALENPEKFIKPLTTDDEQRQP